jgi:uncharacterized protein (DUF1810 family)
MSQNEFEHFLTAQSPVYNGVIAELRAGKKQTHWMWFIFPQLEGLGHSHMARRFALHSLEEARRYLGHPQLGERLRQCSRLVVHTEGRGVSDIFGFPDDRKFHSCMTLFNLAVPDEPLFRQALEKYFGGAGDFRTAELLDP